MRLTNFFKGYKAFVAFSLLLALPAGAAQFVELTAEVQGDDWDYNLFVDRRKEKDRGPVTGLFQPSRTIRCVVGTNMWMIKDTNDDFVMQRWFTGTNFVINEFWIDAQGQMRTGGDAPVNRHEFESADGNPMRARGDLMQFDSAAKFCWMAFCSGPTLRYAGRTIYPTFGMWGQAKIFTAGWKDQTTTFPDELGLPRSIDLVVTNQQPVFQYQAHLTTNFMGWTFPTEFFSVQYADSRSGAGVAVRLTMKGRITSIRAAPEPKIPEDVMAEAHRAGGSWR